MRSPGCDLEGDGRPRRPFNVLILGKDSTLFSIGEETFGDTRKRHVTYAEALHRRHPGSEIRIITYTNDMLGVQTEQVSNALRLYGTGSIHRAMYLPGVLKRLRDVLENGWRPDVVTVQSPWEEGVLGYLIARSLKAKFVPQLHFDLFSEDWKEEHWLNPWRKFVASRVLRWSDRVRVVSNALLGKLESELGIPSDKIDIVPVGVNFIPASGEKEEFKNRISASLQGKKVVLFVGRFCLQKDLPLWVEVAERIGRQLPEVTYVLAGNGPLFQEIRSLVERKRLSDSFHFLGSVGHALLPAVYAAADLFLLTSRYEGLGRVIVEAYSSNVPVVSTACTGPEDLIDSGLDGFLLPCGDAEGLAKAAVRLLGDDALRERFGSRGCAKIADQFSAATLSEKVVSCWERAWVSEKTY